MQFTTDGAKASLHFTKLIIHPQGGAAYKDSKIEMRDDVLVVTIGPNGKNFNNAIICLYCNSFCKKVI